MRSFFVVLCLLLLPHAALGQTFALDRGDLSRGLTLGPTSAALTDDATSLSVNPAGLTFAGPLHAFYLGQFQPSLKSNQGLFVGLAAFDAFGFGYGVEWLHDVDNSPYRKNSFGFSFGAQELSLGISWTSFHSVNNADLNGLGSLDIGLLSRPVRFASFGLLVRNVDNPRRGNAALPIQYQVSLGFRPLGEVFSVGADYLLNEKTALLEGRMNYTLQAKLIRGLSLLGGFSHSLQRNQESYFQVGMTVDLERLGASYAMGFVNQQTSQTLALRMSTEKYPSLFGQAKVVAVVDLDRRLAGSRSTLSTLLGANNVDPYLALMQWLSEAEEDPRLHALIFKADGINLGLAKALEFRHAIERLKKRGKTVYAILLSANDADYLALSACHKVFAVPAAVLELDGFAANVTFLGEAMEKLGVRWEVARVGAYKNAPDQLTRSRMSSEQAESINAYLDTNFGEYIRASAQSRKLTDEKFRVSLNEGLKSTDRALELGLLDEIINPQELDAKLHKWFPGAIYDADYEPNDLRETRWGSRRKVAIIPVIGSITRGPSRDNTINGGDVAGATTIVQALKKAENDDDVEAIVLRIDSGGGDTLASDLIYRAVLQAKKKKPVVASMGDYAASGGYYVAMGADTLFAEPTTLTGSIGVFFVKPAVAELASKLGIRNETIRRGELSSMLGLFDAWSPAERAAAQKWVDTFYDGFISEVSSNRKMTKDGVDKIARGRVWSGQDAKKLNLIDQLGGLQEAIADAKRRAGIPPFSAIELEVYDGDNDMVRSASTRVVRMFSPDVPAWMQWTKELGIDAALNLQPGLRAEMEYSVSVR